MTNLQRILNIKEVLSSNYGMAALLKRDVEWLIELVEELETNRHLQKRLAEPSARFEYSHGDGQGTVTMLLGEIAHGAELYTGRPPAVACPVCLDSGFYPVGGPYLCTHCEKGNEVIKGHLPAQRERSR
jgi:hypothetical protein